MDKEVPYTLDDGDKFGLLLDQVILTFSTPELPPTKWKKTIF